MPKVYLLLPFMLFIIGAPNALMANNLDDDYPKIKKDKYNRAKQKIIFVPGFDDISEISDETREKLTGTEHDLESLDKLIRHRKGEGLTEKMERHQKYLDNKLIGQPEVKKAFLQLVKERAIMGTQDIKPAVFWLAGLPGTGKDTAAMALTDMLTQSYSGNKSHMKYLPVTKNKEAAWGLFGSVTGYVGSQEISPLLKWIVQHSAGKYMIVPGKPEYVALNPRFISFDEPLPGYFRPHQAVIFADELHNWSASAKDDILKKAIETGYFPINNPGRGIDHLVVPINFVMASNDAIDLVSYRDAQGNRRGKQLSFSELDKNWQVNHTNKTLIRDSITKKNDYRNDRGTSEEFLNRIPSNRLILMQPLKPKELEEIAQLKLEEMAAKFEMSNGIYGGIRISFDESIAKTVSTYRYDAELSARHLDANIMEIVEANLYETIVQFDEYFESNPYGHLDVTVDNDMNLRMTYLDHDKIVHTVKTPIEKSIIKKPTPLDGLAELQEIYTNLVDNVFGIEQIATRLTKSVIEREYLKHISKDGLSAAVSMLLGLSSTGKTETAKVFSKQMGKYWNQTGELLLTVDFSNVQTIHQLREKILGTKNAYGDVEPSEFMQHYDKYQGHAVFVFDEASNAPKELLRGLYDIFRESEVTTFADGKPRSMSNIYIFMTGNVGEEWYEEIPKDIPQQEIMNAYMQAYQAAHKNPEIRRKTLLAAFTDALINRVGDENIYFFSPLRNTDIRNLVMHKLRGVFEADLSGESGWDIKFRKKFDLKAFLDFVELEMFSVSEQGASIEHAIIKELRPLIITAMLENHVKLGSKVEIKFAEVVDLFDEEARNDVTQKGLKLSLRTGKNKKIEIVLKGHKRIREFPENKQIMLATAYHEAGHEIVRHALLADKYEPQQIIILPGVGNIGGRMIRYEGLAESIRTDKVSQTKAFVIKRMAGLMAGAVAEDMIAGKHAAGISNDIERASSLARAAILYFGLESERWGWQSFGSTHTSIAEIFAKLSPQQKEKLNMLVDEYLENAYHLAKAVLTVHKDSHFIPMAQELAAKGELQAKQIKEFYQQELDLDKSIEWFEDTANKQESQTDKKLDLQHRLQITDDYQMPDKDVVDLKKLYEEKRLKEIEPVGCHPSLFF